MFFVLCLAAALAVAFMLIVRARRRRLPPLPPHEPTEPKPEIFEVVDGITHRIDPDWVKYKPGVGWIVDAPTAMYVVNLGDGRWFTGKA